MSVQDGDNVYFQFKMNPCGDDLICGQPVLGPELVTNGVFDGATGWEEAGNNWTIAASQACYTAADGGGVLYQTIADLTAGLVYRVSFTITDYVAGTLRPFLWGNAGSAVSADGTYVQYITLTLSSNNFLDFTDIGWNGCITNISVVATPNDCWNTSFSGDDPFTYTQDGICVSGTGNFFTNTLANDPGYFVVSFTISNYVSGTVTVSGACTDTFVGSPFGANGEKFAYGVFAAPGVVCFEFTDFYGCISYVHLNRLFLPQVAIVNTETNAQSLILNDDIYVTISGNSITWKFKMSNLGLAHGCYTFCVTDICGVEENNLIKNGGFDVDLSDWTAGDGWENDGEGHAVYESAGMSNNPLSQMFPEQLVCAKVEVLEIGTNQSVIFRIKDAGIVTAQVGIGQPGIYAVCGIGDEIELTTALATHILIDNVIVRAAIDCDDCHASDYCSNCINFVERVTDCTLLIEGYNNENSFGFTFVNQNGTNIFKLSHRVNSKLWHPGYPEESNDYTFSDGKTADTFALSDKFWILGIDPASERAHDVLRLQKRSDHFVITDVNESREMWADKGDYNPDWPDGGCKAPANIKVKLKTSTLYNNLCTE